MLEMSERLMVKLYKYVVVVVVVLLLHIIEVAHILGKLVLVEQVHKMQIFKQVISVLEKEVRVADL